MAIMNVLPLLICFFVGLLQHGETDEFKDPSGWDHRRDWQKDSLCGPNALFIVARLSGSRLTYQDVRNTISIDPNRGCSVADLDSAARQLNIDYRARKITPSELKAGVDLPIVIHTINDSSKWNTGHFLVLVGISEKDKAYRIVDPVTEVESSFDYASMERAMSGLALVPTVDLVESSVMFWIINLVCLCPLCLIVYWLVWRRKSEA